MAEYPCKTCKRVKDPRGCENKNCNDWCEWLLEKWKGFNRYYEKHKHMEMVEDGKVKNR